MPVPAAPATSARDPRVLAVAALLRDGAARRRERRVALDSDALITAALEEGVVLELVLEASGRPPAPWRAALGPEVPLASASGDALRALAVLGRPPGAVAIARLPPPPQRSVPAGSLLLAGVGDAGNVGSIVRTAAALGLPRVWLCGEDPDAWSRKALRASQGAALRPGLVGEVPRLADLADLPARAPLVAAVPRGGIDPGNLPAGAAVVLGAEHGGLSAEERAACDAAVTIPAPGFESLNVAAAAAILSWELSRRPASR